AMRKDRYVHGKNMLLLDLGIGNAINDIGLKGVRELTGIVQDDIAWMSPPPGVEVTITGNSVVFTTVIWSLTSGRVAMTLTGLILVFLGLLVIYRDWVKALTPVITMFMVIGWAGGIMYFTGIDYTPMTATLGALILGVGSEYAVLMMERYYEERDKGVSPVEAMEAASSKIGKAIVASGLTTLFGFSALIASPFSMNSNFGLVTVLDVALALLATFIVFPAVLVKLDEWREKRKALHAVSARKKDRFIFKSRDVDAQ
ncbi:MAG: MMPL family transporter, partial [Methanosarcinales archaeon]|nr:MMPL family transporter [Methanosarcinales archaeon]